MASEQMMAAGAQAVVMYGITFGRKIFRAKLRSLPVLVLPQEELKSNTESLLSATNGIEGSFNFLFNLIFK